MNRRILLATTVLATTLATSGAFAQSRSVDTITVTGKHIVTQTIPLKSTYSTSNISQQQIRNASPGPTTTVQTLLTKVPSIQAVTSGPAGMRTNVTFRAFNDGQFGQTFDGVTINDSFNGGTSNAASNRNNTLLITQDIDGIDVHRGINNPAVNTYNSLGGTINYVPRAPGDAFSADAGTSYGSFNTFSYHATVNSGDWHGFKALASFQHDYSGGWIKNTQDHNNNFYFNGEKDLDGGNSKLSAVLVYNDNQGYTPHSMPIALIQSQGYDTQWPSNWTYSYNTDTSWLGIVGYNTKGDHTDFDIKLYGSGNDYRRTSYTNPAFISSASQPYYLPNTPASYHFWLTYPIPVTYDAQAVFGDYRTGHQYHFYGYERDTGGGQTKLTLDLPYNKVTLGGDFSYSSLHSREYWYGTSKMPMIVGYNDAWDEHDNRTLASGYIQDDIHLWDDRVHLVPGVKYLYAHTSDSDALGFYYPLPGTVTGDDHYVSPTFGASVEAVKNLVFYAAYGQNTKFPDITAYYNAFQQDNSYNPVIVPVHVKPEYVNDYEVGARYKWKGLTAAFNYYREDFRSIFVTVTDQASGVSHTSNGGAARYQGEEVMLTADLGKWLIGSWNGYLNYAHNEAVYTKNAEISDTGVSASFVKGQKVPNVPQDLVSAGVTWNYDNWRVDLSGRYVGDRYVGDGYDGAPLSPAVKIPTYTVLDLAIDKIIPLNFASARAVKLSLHVDNLTDEHYYTRETTDYGDTTNPTPGIDPATGQYLKALAGEGRAVFGSVSVYF